MSPDVWRNLVAEDQRRRNHAGGSCQLRVPSKEPRSTLPFRDHCYSRLHCKLDHGVASTLLPSRLVPSRLGLLKLQHRCAWTGSSLRAPLPPHVNHPFQLVFPPLLPSTSARRSSVAGIAHTRPQTCQGKKANCFSSRANLPGRHPSPFLCFPASLSRYVIVEFVLRV